MTQSGRPAHLLPDCGVGGPDPTERPLDQARTDLKARSHGDGDPTATVEDLVTTSADGKQLEQLSNVELLRKADREVTKAVYVVSQALLLQPTHALSRPAELGVLVQALAACARAVTAGFAQAERMEAPDRTTAEISTGGEQNRLAALAEALRPFRDRAPVPDPAASAP